MILRVYTPVKLRGGRQVKMSSLHTALCVTGLLLMLSSGVLGQIEVAPVNTAGWVGEEGRLNCTINRENGDHIAWSFLTGTEDTTLYSTFKPDEIEPGYEVDYDGQNRVDLILDPITAAKGGRYRCFLVLDTDTRVRAEFVSLDEMRCDSGQGETAVEEGTKVKFICDVTYHSEIIQPALQWYNDQGFTLPSFPETDEENPNRIIMTTIITANSDHDMRKFECRLMFDGEGAPTFTSSCDSHVLVNYGARQVELHSEPENENDVLLLRVGSEINCSARGRPKPDISWHGEGSETEIIEGNILVMKERFADGVERTYRCEATNVISGQTRTANRTVRFRVTDGDEGTVTAGTQLIVGVVLAVVAAAAFAAGGYLFYRKKATKDGDDHSSKRPSYSDNNKGFRDDQVQYEDIDERSRDHTMASSHPATKEYDTYEDVTKMSIMATSRQHRAVPDESDCIDVPMKLPFDEVDEDTSYMGLHQYDNITPYEELQVIETIA